jgi:hypothetical protein
MPTWTADFPAQVSSSQHKYQASACLVNAGGVVCSICAIARQDVSRAYFFNRYYDNIKFWTLYRVKKSLNKEKYFSLITS